MKRYLVLEDGTFYEGKALGAGRFRTGELVFNTSMTGYQEVISDPACCGQIAVMTYTVIGNTGVNNEDNESLNPSLFGLVLRDYNEVPSNFRSRETLDHYLVRNGIPAICGIDTRALTRKIRSSGVIKASFCDREDQIAETVSELKSYALPRDLVSRVSTKNVYPIPGRGKKVVLIDFGVKLSVLRELSNRGCDITVVPYNTSAEEILDLYPDGVVLSGGPGDPADLPSAANTIRKLIGKTAIFGIGLGHQLLAIAGGAKTYRMDLGHRGGVPVKVLAEDHVEITSQNHGYAVDAESLKNTDFEMTHVSVNDKVCEGIAHKSLPCFSVQFRPEASAGPRDSIYLFDKFIEMMKEEENNA